MAEYDILEDIPLGVQVLKPVFEGEAIVDFIFVFVNSTAAAIGRSKAEEMVGKRVLTLFPNIAKTQMVRRFTEAYGQNKNEHFEQAIPAQLSVHKRDMVYRIHLRRRGDLLLMVHEDVSSQKDLEKKLIEQATVDVLTGLYNRRYFETRSKTLLALAARRDWKVAVIYADLDGFKKINDTMGHATGDALLQGFAKRLQEQTRGQDILFRMGGDEFGFFLIDTTREKVELMLSRIRARLTEPFNLHGGNQRVSASFGFSIKHAKDANLAEMLSEADKKMYGEKKRVKSKGNA